MIVIGLTGSIGMGKSTVTQMFRDLGISVHEADACVHTLFEKDSEIIAKIAALLPKATENGKIDRKILGDYAFASKNNMQQLEAIVYPKLAQKQREFLSGQTGDIVALDIPLLFEGGYEKICNYVIVVTCAPKLQEQRVLKRPNMTMHRLQQISSLQMSEQEKIARADFIIHTDGSQESVLAELKEVLNNIINHLPER